MMNSLFLGRNISRDSLTKLMFEHKRNMSLQSTVMEHLKKLGCQELKAFHVTPSGISVDILLSQQKKVVIEMEGPLFDAGLLSFKRRLLEKEGFRVLSLNRNEWESLLTEDAKDRFLQNLIGS